MLLIDIYKTVHTLLTFLFWFDIKTSKRQNEQYGSWYTAFGHLRHKKQYHGEILVLCPRTWWSFARAFRIHISHFFSPAAAGFDIWTQMRAACVVINLPVVIIKYWIQVRVLVFMTLICALLIVYIFQSEQNQRKCCCYIHILDRI